MSKIGAVTLWGKRDYWLFFIGFGLFLSTMLAQAFTLVTVSVVVFLVPSCVINNNQPITVDFSNTVMTTRVDGNNYLQTVKYTLVCSGQSSNNMKMQIQGVDAGFANGALKTSNDNLAIALSSGETPLPINGWVRFTYPNLPVLRAVPVKRPGAILAGGIFSASSTMVVEYQ